jgi:hypothetical protein
MATNLFNWKSLEAECDRVVNEVIGDLGDLEPGTIPPNVEAVPSVTRSRLRLPTFRETILLAFAGVAVSLAGVLWFSQIMQSAQKDTLQRAALPQPVTTTTEQQLLADYRAKLAQTRAKLDDKADLGPNDPFAAPSSYGNRKSRVRTELAPRYTPSIAYLPPPAVTPLPMTPSLQALPPLPGPLVQQLGITKKTVASVEVPTLVGVMEGEQRTAVFQQGEGIKEFKAGEQLNNGWTVQEIKTSQAILKKGGQTRTVNLGGNE